uniref:Uncharacterized protein n=1 Tax=Pristionchus pacificus TaxID=54126 RepID=A0A2A6BW21_PRIPA|eukprot:PDM70026.1 hypothetical protein PRIPAC_49238 [Pristionchus pacificus]
MGIGQPIAPDSRHRRVIEVKQKRPEVSIEIDAATIGRARPATTALDAQRAGHPATHALAPGRDDYGKRTAVAHQELTGTELTERLYERSLSVMI